MGNLMSGRAECRAWAIPSWMVTCLWLAALAGAAVAAEKSPEAVHVLAGSAHNTTADRKGEINLGVIASPKGRFQLAGTFTAGLAGRIEAVGAKAACPSGMSAKTCYRFDGKLVLDDTYDIKLGQPKFHLDLRLQEDGTAAGEYRIAAMPPQLPQAQEGAIKVATETGFMADGLLAASLAPEASVAAYARLLAAHSDQELGIRYYRGHKFELMGKFPEAIADFRRAQELDPKNPSIRGSLGWVLLLNGQLDEARKEMEKGESNFANLVNLGHTYWLHGNEAQARYWYEASIVRIPDEAVLKAGPLADFDLFIRRGMRAEAAQQERSRFEQAYRESQQWRRQVEQLIAQGKPFRDCPDCPEMVVIPAGSFEMGSNSGDKNEKPVHTVRISKPFALAKTELTLPQWHSLMGGTDPSGPKYAAAGSWNEVQQYLHLLFQKTGKRYRLPSEAEWEYACRAGERHKYCGSDDADRVAQHGDGSKPENVIGSKQPNAWGLYDMSGDIAEWVEDCWNDSYNGAPTDGSAWMSGDCRYRVDRGGSWMLGEFSVRAASRSKFRVFALGRHAGVEICR